MRGTTVLADGIDVSETDGGAAEIPAVRRRARGRAERRFTDVVKEDVKVVGVREAEDKSR